MTIDARLSLLLARWRQSQASGTPLPVEEVCRDCPELLPEVERRIAVLQDGASPAEGNGARPEGRATPPSEPSGDSSGRTLPLGEEAAHPPAVPGFEIEGELGRGGWGVVYRARQTRLNRTVALKMILSGGHAAPEARN